jgi:DNA-binding response OmpR family regulator
MVAGMAGEEILSLLKPLSLKQRIVLVSGRDKSEGTATARHLGAAAGYIQKPVDTRQLTSLLYDHLQDRIRDASVTEPATPQAFLERLVLLVFGECKLTRGRKVGAVGILMGLILVVGLLVIG